MRFPPRTFLFNCTSNRVFWQRKEKARSWSNKRQEGFREALAHVFQKKKEGASALFRQCNLIEFL